MTPKIQKIQPSVRGRSLAELHDSHGPFNALLMDVEGSELEILKSSSDLLLECSQDMLLASAQ